MIEDNKIEFDKDTTFEKFMFKKELRENFKKNYGYYPQTEEGIDFKNYEIIKNFKNY